MLLYGELDLLGSPEGQFDKVDSRLIGLDYWYVSVSHLFEMSKQSGGSNCKLSNYSLGDTQLKLHLHILYSTYHKISVHRLGNDVFSEQS